MSDHDKLIGLLARESVRHGHFTLASGKASTIYIDARMTTMSPEGQKLIGSLAISAIREARWTVDSVGGLTLGADPIAYSISYASNSLPPLLRAFTVRKAVKPHGSGKLIEGPFRPGDHVVVVEDVITTGESAIQAINAIRNANGLISGVLALVDRAEGGREAIEKEGYQVISLVHITQLAAGFSESP